MNISRRMGVTISGLAFAGAVVGALGTGGTANAQTATVTPQHAATGYSTVNRHRYYWGGGDGYTVDVWYWWGGGCGCGCC